MRTPTAWPSHNLGLSNTRADFHTEIDARDVASTRGSRSVTPSGGPNGVAYGYAVLFAETENAVFALDPPSTLWATRGGTAAAGFTARARAAAS